MLRREFLSGAVGGLGALGAVGDFGALAKSALAKSLNGDDSELCVEATFFLSDGSTEKRAIPLAVAGDVQALRIPQGDLPQGLVKLELRHPWAKARAGEPGFFVFPNGMLGVFKETENGEYVDPHTTMQTFGVSTPRGTTAAILKGLGLEAVYVATVRDGAWEVFPRYRLDGIAPYEDVEIDYVVIPQDRATYAETAAAYRRFKLERGDCELLRERVKNRPELKRAVEAPEIRVRLGWKPVPSPVAEQNADNEPPMHTAITFDRFKEIAAECKRQGIDRAEFCLVGWNVGGHDGRYPQIFPVDERLGGEEKLKEAVAAAQKLGFQVVCHTNYSDAYRASQIGGRWDENYLLIRKDGNFNTYTTWGGGAMYETCPKEMCERFADVDFPAIRALGFSGLHYLDVYSTVDPRTCWSKEHPLTKRDFAFWTNKIFEKASATFGGLASEGGFDYCVKYLDYALYISFQKPEGPLNRLVERQVPYWQLVYSGIVPSNPFSETTNYTLKSPVARLKTIEFGARPAFYFYSKFKSDGSAWMGDVDLTCETDEELRASVAKIKEGYDEYSQLAHLQYEQMTSHDEIAPGVFEVGYSDGTKIVVNYTDADFERAGKTVAPLGYAVYPGSARPLFYRNPGGIAGDPSVLRKPSGEVVEYDGKYWLYFTSERGDVRGYEARSTRNFVDWEDEGVVFDATGTWARDAFWAPEGYEIGGKFYLFFSAQNAEYPWTTAEKFNIGVAVADSPRGPFKLLKDEPLFDPGYPIIDANLFIDDDGTPYLTFSRCCYQHPVDSELADKVKREKKFDSIEESWAYGVRLKPDFSGIVGEPTLLIRPPATLDDRDAEWESRSVTSGEVNRRWTEGTALFKINGTYYIVYSANFFGGDWYAVGYATAPSPLGPYRKAANNPILEKNTQTGGIVRGTGHGNVFFSPDRSEAYYVYHARTEGNDRKMFIDRMLIADDGTLSIDGPSVDPRPVPAFVRR